MSGWLPLSQGLFAIVDDADFDWLNQWKWSLNSSARVNYAYRAGTRRGHYVRLHRLIMGARPGQVVDHINGNGLDNRRANLRLATPQQNACNSQHRRPSPGGYRGITLQEGKWYGRVTSNGRFYWTASFLTPEGAAFERDLYAMELHGEFAVLNFPEQHTVWAGHGYTRYLPEPGAPHPNVRISPAAFRITRSAARSQARTAEAR